MEATEIRVEVALSGLQGSDPEEFRKHLEEFLQGSMAAGVKVEVKVLGFGSSYSVPVPRQHVPTPR